MSTALLSLDGSAVCKSLSASVIGGTVVVEVTAAAVVGVVILVSLRFSNLLGFRVRPVNTEMPGVFFDIPPVLDKRLLVLGPMVATESGDDLFERSALEDRRDDFKSLRPLPA